MAVDQKPKISELNELIRRSRNEPKADIDGVKVNNKTKKKSESTFSDDLKKMQSVSEERSAEVFRTYKNTNVVFSKAKPHPGNIVEAACLADVNLPEVTYDLFEAIPDDIVDNGKLSSMQLEGVLYACQRHLTLLPDGTRAGFFIGDAAGVGKGRQIAGIILNNLARGRKKHIWFSISHDLKVDAERDLRDIGCHVKVIDGCQQLDKETRALGLSSGYKEGVIFSTYATLTSSTHKGKASRLDQLMKWCGGENFDGCLIFDECHKAKNFVPGKDNVSSKVAIAVTSLQRMLPKARVVYCSATGVSEVKNLAYMERLGLWGEGLPHRRFESFMNSIMQRGLGAAEMIAMEMKAAGTYVCRGLSYQDTEFVLSEVSLSKDQIITYNTAAHIWEELKKSLEVALGRIGGGPTYTWGTFWGAHQRFFKQLCMSLKAPFVVEEAKKALADGHCVVIGLQTTGEASMTGEISRSGSPKEFISLTKEILLSFVEGHFPVDMNKPGYEDGVDNWCVQAKAVFVDFITKMDLPKSPLDWMIDALGGPSLVAEMTGRRGRVVRRSNGRLHYELRGDETSGLESVNNAERQYFMTGKKLVAIISEAASTGISLHADERCQNNKRRVHITMELPWTADKAVQQLGRTHRSNQTSGPLYKLVCTNVGGERRFAAAVAKRLQSLGALTKGDRRAAVVADLEEFNFDSVYGKQALKNMYNGIMTSKLPHNVTLERICKVANILEAECPSSETFHRDMKEAVLLLGIAIGSLDNSVIIHEKELKDVTHFLNRVLGLKIQLQNLLFAYFVECVNVVIAQAKQEGRYSEGVTDIQASSVTLAGPPKDVFTTCGVNKPPTIHTHVLLDRGVMWESACELLRDGHSHENNGFYRSNREQFGRHLYLLALQKDSAPHLFHLFRPNTGRSYFEEKREDLFQKYVKITAEEAEEGWRTEFERTKDKCIHRASCKAGESCKIGSRVSHLHLLSGGVLALLSVLEEALLAHADAIGLNKELKTLKVVRVKLDSGQRLIGLRYHEELIEIVEKLLKDKFPSNPKAELAKLVTDCETERVPGNLLVHLLECVGQQGKTFQQQDEVPVQPKALKSALTPPPTLFNFFKPLSDSTPGVKREPLCKPPDYPHPRSVLSPSLVSSSKRRRSTLLDSRQRTLSSFTFKRCTSLSTTSVPEAVISLDEDSRDAHSTDMDTSTPAIATQQTTAMPTTANCTVTATSVTGPCNLTPQVTTTTDNTAKSETFYVKDAPMQMDTSTNAELDQDVLTVDPYASVESNHHCNDSDIGTEPKKQVKDDNRRTRKRSRRSSARRKSSLGENSSNISLCKDEVSKPASEPKGKSEGDGSVPVKRRRSRCGACEGCCQKDCRTCDHCRDMKKFGGPGIRKQACRKRKCVQRMNVMPPLQDIPAEQKQSCSS